MAEASELLRVPESEYGARYRGDVFSMYQDYIDSADKISDRRHQANTLFLTINTALVAFAGTLLSEGQAGFLWIVALAGIYFCSYWKKLIDQYRGINSAKFDIIHQMEQQLPMAPYDAEWALLEEGKDESVHQPFTKIEATIPRIFTYLHGVTILMSLLLLANTFISISDK